MQKPRLPAITSCTHISKVGRVQFSYMAPPPISVSAHQGISYAVFCFKNKKHDSHDAPAATGSQHYLATLLFLPRLTAAKVVPPSQQPLKQLRNLASFCQKRF